MLIVRVADEAPFPQTDVRDVRVIWRNALRVSPTIIVSLVRDVVVKRTTAVADVWRDVGHVFNRARLRLDCFGVRDGQRFAQTFRTIFTRAGSGREMKSVDVVRAIFFNHGNDVLSQAGEQRRDADRGHHADHDSEYSQKTAKLVPAHAVERHLESFAQNAFWQPEFHELRRVR